MIDFARMVEPFRRKMREWAGSSPGTEKPVHMFEDRIIYTPTICDGSTELKSRYDFIQDEAIRITNLDMNHHPCGCAVCHANTLLFNMRRLRIVNNVDPVTGKVLPPIHPTG